MWVSMFCGGALRAGGVSGEGVLGLNMLVIQMLC